MQFKHAGLLKKLSVFMVFVVIVLLIGHEVELYLPDLEIWINEMGALAPVGYILVFVILTPIFISVDALCFAGGILFPIITGEVTIIISTYLSAALIFFMGRNLIREKVLAFITKHKSFSTLSKFISGGNGFKLMFLLRLTPLPFAMLSYSLAITDVKFLPYLAATTGILLYNGSLVYLGYTTKHLTGLVKHETNTCFASHSMLVFYLLIILVIVIWVTKIAGDTLKQLNLENSDG